MAYDSSNPFVVADAAPADRAQFYRRTYTHVAGAFVAWCALMVLFFNTGIAEGIINLVFNAGMIGMLAIMLGMSFLATFAQKIAFTGRSTGAQYGGLALAVLSEAVIFVPLIFLVVLKTQGKYTDHHLTAEAWAESMKSVFLPSLATTGLLIAGLTATVLMTRTDFSFLRTAITIGLFASMGIIIAAMIFGITLGFWFSVAMVVLMAGCILWETSNLKYRVSPDQHIGAATMLFISFMTMLWYVIRLFNSRRD